MLFDVWNPIWIPSIVYNRFELNPRCLQNGSVGLCMQKGEEVLACGAAIGTADRNAQTARQQKAIMLHGLNMTEVDPVALVAADKLLRTVRIQ